MVFIHAANVVTRIWKHKELKTCVCNVSQAACSFKVWEKMRKRGRRHYFHGVQAQNAKKPPGNFFDSVLAVLGSLS